MKVLLTHGYFLYDDLKEQEIMRPYSPLGILYISAYLEMNGIDNAVFDSTFSSKPAFREYLLKHRPPYVAIYVNLMTKLNVLETIKFIKESDELKDTRIILGGPEIRYNAQNFLKQGADFLVIGEGEETTLELVMELEKGVKSDFNHINGIAYLDENKQEVFTKERTKIKEVDQLPFPNRKKIDLHQYLKVWKERHGLNAISISTMRGCPYTCKWCSRAVYGMSYRRRSAQKVVDEM